MAVQSASGSSLAPLGFMTCNITLGNKAFQHDFVVYKHLMRPLILGREFLFKNELKVYYSKTGECKLDYKQEELVATIDPQNDLTLTLKSGVYIPGRTVAILNVNSSIHQNNIGQFYNVRANSLLEDEHPQLQIVPTLHKVDTATTTLIPFVLINLGEDYVFLPKGQVVEFLDAEYIDVSEINLDIASVTVNSMNTPTTIKEKIVTTNQNIVPSDFITSPADIAGPCKADLQDFEIMTEETKAFNKLCDKYADVFSDNSGDIGRTPLIKMDIDTGENPPVCQRPYTLPLKHAEWVKKELNILEAAGIIVRSVSPWASPIVIVPKRSAPGEPPKRRMCVDYRALNKLLPPVKKAHSNAKGILSLVPLPKIDEIYACLRGSKVFSTLNMHSGYHHVEMTAEARPKTAFTLLANLGKWEYLCCPFGLAQAPAYFQRLINEVLAPFDFAFGYLDDILIYSPDVNTHLKHLELIFQHLREVDLKLKMEKCSFLKKYIQYLGHIVSGEGLKPVPEKLSSIQQMPRPYTPKRVKQFLGLVGYYRKFIPRYADIIRPLNALTHKDVEFVWTDMCQRSFDLLKTMVTEEPILVYPDPSKPYALFTDASKYAWSFVLTQEYTHNIEGKTVKRLHPISYQSGPFKGSQFNWACLTKEAYAIYMSIKKLDYYLVDADIILHSDHLPLKKFLNKNTLNSKVNNWAVEISPFHITFEYIKGIKNTLADTMSRLIDIDPESRLPPEEQGCEYGYYLFDPLPPISIEDVCHVDDIPEITITNLDQVTSTYFDPKDPGGDVDRLLSLLGGAHYEVISSLQDRDIFCHQILTQLHKAKCSIGQPYTIDNDSQWSTLLPYCVTTYDDWSCFRIST